MSRRAAAAPVVGAATLMVAALALQRSGRGLLAAPPLNRPERWADWLQGRDPIAAAFSLVRVAGLAALWYLAAITVVGLVLRLLGAARLVAATDRLTVAPVRRLLAGVSLGLAATTVVAVAAPATLLPAAMAAQAAPTSTSTTSTSTTSIPTASTGTASTGTTVPGSPDTITMHLLPPADATPAELAPAPPPATASVPVPDVAAGTSTAVIADQWTVRPGECFWTIAESVLAGAWGRAPSDAEIVPYWQRLIAANAGVLAHPGNPDLIFPGQVFSVPAP
ncbi:MAG TPA: hypothetical protein VHT97_00940 [Acidimicrobiales bacterium]|nr:hypothetical protein [Acidimicrobiales bacterium]